MRLPDGTIVRGVPDTITKAELVAKLKGNGMQVPAEWLPAAPEPKGNDIARQAGLFARSGIKGALSLPAIGADAIGGLWNAGLDAAGVAPVAMRVGRTLGAVDSLMTKAGLPEPQTPMERIVGRAVEAGSGAGFGAGALGALSNGATGATKAVLSRLSADPALQVVGGASSGAAGQHSAEQGGGWGSQLASSMLGGVGGAGAFGAARGAARTLSTQAPKLADVERRITVALQSQGINPATIEPAVKASIIRDAQAAMKMGGLSEPALARLTDYRRLGLTPTRGRMTLDPMDVTREQNAMRMAATTGVDARLPAIAHGNNAGLLRAVDDMAPLNDRFAAGDAAMRPIAARDAAMKANVDTLYSQARDTAGRSAEMDGAAFTRQVGEALHKNLAPKLGAEVDQAINDIATGKTPLTVEYAQQLTTMLSRKAQSAKSSGNGDLAYAYGLVRQALDDVPLKASPRVNPGNLPAVAGTVPPSRATIGQESIDAFNAARSAAKQRFGWQESATGITKALDGATADTFVQQQILARSAGLKDVGKLAAEIKTDPQALQAVRGAIVQHLKDAGAGRGNESATANFSGRGWSAAVEGIGEKKLGLFFSPAEVEQIKAIGRVGTAETFQPRGSAVNNSNTAAAAAAAITKALGPLANKLPFGQAAVSAPLNNLTLSLTERGATNVPRGLLAPSAPRYGTAIDPLLLPLLSGGLLSIQP